MKVYPPTRNFKIGKFDKDTSTTTPVSVTGLGFKPRYLMVYALVDNTIQNSEGWTDGINQYCHLDYSIVSGADFRAYQGSRLAHLQQTAAISSWATLTSLDTDGFTLAFAKSGAKTGTATFFWTAFG